MQSKILAMTTFCLSLLCLQPLYAQEAAPTPLPTWAPVLKKSIPAIVNIAIQGVIPPDPLMRSRTQRPIGPNAAPADNKPQKFESIGSGVIIDPENGIVITNEHVIRLASIITVTLNDGRRLKAKLIGSDSETDIAVLHIDAKNLQTLKMGNSDKVEVGDYVVAIGNPFGLNNFGNSQSATFGIVSAKQRSDLNIEGIENFIQTDAAINPGNSGGALINTQGELIGINTAIISMYGGNVGIGFAIPINMALDVAGQIEHYGSVHRGMMGIFVQPITPELAQAMGYSEKTQGALVAQVNDNSPAALAGLKSGDLITKINDTPITQASQVKSTVSMLRVGSDVNIAILRQGKPVSIHATVTDMKKQEQALLNSNPFLFGLALQNFAQDTSLQGQVQGVQIVGAAESSPGWRGGLRPGDVIISANGQPVKDTATLRNLAKQNSKQLLLQVLRGQGALFVLVS